MKRNEEITMLSNEILIDISHGRTPLHISLLKAARLSLLLNIPQNIELFKEWAKDAESMEFVVGSFQSRIEAAKDPHISYAGGNNYYTPHGNNFERAGIRKETDDKVRALATYKAETYKFVMGIYAQWQFENIVEGVFEKKRKRTEPILPKIITDIQNRFNSIEQNLKSENPEDWKNAVASCRTLLTDLANTLLPSKTPDEKSKFISRLQTYISPLESKTKKSLLKTVLDEIKLRIEYTMNLTQGAAHNDRPLKDSAEDVVLYTYLIVSEIADVYILKQKKKDEI